MSFLEQFFEDNFDTPPKQPGNSGPRGDSAPPIEGNSFKKVTDSELAAHLEVDTYDHFHLTGAVRPALDLKVLLLAAPRQSVVSVQIGE